MGGGFAELDAVPASSPSRVQFGRCDATSGILTAVHKMPRKWQLELEAEADRAEGVEDLAVTAELEELEEQCNEHADVDLAVELLEAPLPYDAAPEDAAKTSNMQLAPVPALVEQQWKQYAAYRQQPFNRHRSTGAAVEDTTVESDRANALRWLGYLKAEHGQAPSLKLFAHEQVGAWTEAWVLKLRALGLKGSTIAVYVNGVISVSAYACAALAPDGGELCPTHELITLRRQAESISKQERLFEAKHPSWLSWEEAQKARQACVEKYNAATERHEKQRLLKDALALAFHTLQPPVRPSSRLCITLASSHLHALSARSAGSRGRRAPPPPRLPGRLAVQGAGREHVHGRPEPHEAQDEPLLCARCPRADPSCCRLRLNACAAAAACVSRRRPAGVDAARHDPALCRAVREEHRL